jgi:hypothetical protein
MEDASFYEVVMIVVIMESREEYIWWGLFPGLSVENVLGVVNRASSPDFALAS